MYSSTQFEIKSAVLKSFDYASLKRALAYHEYDIEEITLADNLVNVVSDIVFFFTDSGKISEFIDILKSESTSDYIQKLLIVPMSETRIDYSTVSKQIDELRLDVRQVQEFLVGPKFRPEEGLISRFKTFEQELQKSKIILHESEAIQEGLLRERILGRIFMGLSAVALVSLLGIVANLIW